MTTEQQQRAVPDPTQNGKRASVDAVEVAPISSALFRWRTRPPV